MSNTIKKVNYTTKKPELKNGILIMNSCRKTVLSFLKIYEELRKSRGSKGASKDDEEDLLRAMFLFSASGLDAVLKRVIKDSLAKVISKSEGAKQNFETFVKREIKKVKNSEDAVNVDLISLIATSDDPKEELIKHLIYHLNSNSLQSKDQVLKITSYFDIASNLLTDDINKLAEVFKIRNEIIHEMDMDLHNAKAIKTNRTKQDMIDNTNIILNLTENFVMQVGKKLE